MRHNRMSSTIRLWVRPLIQQLMLPCNLLLRLALHCRISGPPQGDSPNPHGTGESAPRNGQCPVSKPWDNEDEIVTELAWHKMSAFDEAAGWFFFNFKVPCSSKRLSSLIVQCLCASSTHVGGTDGAMELEECVSARLASSEHNRPPPPAVEHVLHR